MPTSDNIYDFSQYPEEPPPPIPITLRHPTPDTAEFDLDGVTYTITRKEILPDIRMLLCESAFYQRFGRGEEVLPQIKASFQALDQTRKCARRGCTQPAIGRAHRGILHVSFCREHKVWLCELPTDVCIRPEESAWRCSVVHCFSRKEDGSDWCSQHMSAFTYWNLEAL